MMFPFFSPIDTKKPLVLVSAPMKADLTDRIVSSLKAPRRGQIEVWDAKTMNLYLRVSQGGRKTWMVQLYDNGHRTRETLGQFPGMSVTEARSAVRLKGMLDIDIVKPALTFAKVFERFMREASLASTTRAEWRRLFDREVDPVLGSLDANDATAFRAKLRGLLERKARKSIYTRNRTFEVVRRVYNWGAGQDFISPAPVFAGFEKLPEVPRERVFSDAELRAILHAIHLEYPEWRAYWKLLIYTGARRGTVLQARWDHIDLEQKAWLIPSEGLKGRVGTRRDTVTPLVDQLVRALEFQREISGHTPFVVANLRSGRMVDNPQKAADRVRKTSGINNWHVHDLRHAVSTGLARLRVPPHIIDRVLHHTSGTRMHRRYNQWEYFDEKREALIQWAAYLDGLKTGRLEGATAQAAAQA